MQTLSRFPVSSEKGFWDGTAHYRPAYLVKPYFSTRLSIRARPIALLETFTMLPLFVAISREEFSTALRPTTYNK